ncbi:Trypsin [Popillia japonica]|uniref:Trypsin n=1 Tax=Popillia japonica TaxID=7064 RepID=A0AAW1K438_POPJA
MDLFDVRKYQSNMNCTGYFDVCCDASKTLAETSTELPRTFKGCGYVKNHPFPWFGMLYYQADISQRPKHKCGISFIHKEVALTAAHCLDQNGIWTVRKDKTIINIKRTISHPSYRATNLSNDIALIILDKPIELTDNMGLICVPPPNTALNNISCTVSTLNRNLDDFNQIILIEIPIVPKQTCLNKLRSTRLGDFFQLHYSFLCAGSENQDTCEGDGGSPLVCPIAGQPGRFHQTGIVSWGIGCAENNVPGVYVNVALFRDWIDEVMIENGFDIHSYRY